MSPKYHTTRGRVNGVLTATPHQIVFFDTPGFTQDGYAGVSHCTARGCDDGSCREERFNKELQRAAVQAIHDVEVVLYVVDSARSWTRGCRDTMDAVAGLASRAGAHSVLVLNKTDLLARDAPRRAASESMIGHWEAAGGGESLPSGVPSAVRISALKNVGMDALKSLLFSLTRPRPW